MAEILHHVKIPRRLPWQAKLAAALEGPARFVVAVMGRRAGKTQGASDIAGDTALETCGLVFWGAPTHDTASVGRDTFLDLWKPVVEKTTINPPEARLYGGGRVLWRSFDRPGAALGRGIDLAIVDEAARVKRQVIYEDLLPTIGDTGGKVLAITTPRGRRSWVFDWYTKARSGDPLYACVHGPSTENPMPEIQQFVEIARANMPEHLFRQEIMAEFVEGAGAVFRQITENASLECWRDGPSPDSAYVIGADLAKHQDFTVLYAVDVATGELHGMDRFQHISWPAQIERIKAFSERWNAPIWIDATGVGDPIFDELDEAGLPVTPIKFTSESKSALVVALMNAMEKGEIRYPADDVLIGELEAFTYEELPSGKFRYSAPEGLHDDCVMALALAVWGRNRSTVDLSGYGWVA